MSNFKVYHGKEIDVSYNTKRCLHAAECVKGLPEVFDVQKRPWVQPDHADVESVVSVIERCPTGALEYERKDSGNNETPPSKTTIKVDEEGRMYIHGHVQIEYDNETIQLTRATLCGCGYSNNTPFCDNNERCKPIK